MKKSFANEADYQPEGLQLMDIQSQGFVTITEIKQKLEDAAKTGKYPRLLMSQRRKK